MSARAPSKQIIDAEAAALRRIFDEKFGRTGEMTQERFGQEYELGGQAMVWQYLNGRRPVSLKAALKFARGLGVSVEVFSPRLAHELQSVGATQVAEPSRGGYDVDPAAISLRRPTLVPIVGTAQAGDKGYWVELEHPAGHGEGFVKYYSRDRNAYALRVKGDSMRPRIKPGEFVVVEPNHACSPGDEVIVKTKDGKSMVKELGYQRNGMVELRSINHDHAPITLDVSEIQFMHHVAGIAKSALYEPEARPDSTDDGSSANEE
jgi:phage repressor protein C with HTH and peptisase S24 domain